MCAGYFSRSSRNNYADGPGKKKQIALAGQNGDIYIMENYKVWWARKNDTVAIKLHFRIRH